MRCLERVSAHALEPSRISYNTAMATLGQALFWHRSLSLVGFMRSDMASPDDFSINTLVTACEKRLQWEAAVSVVDQFCLHSAIQVDVIGKNAAISACGNNGLWQLASSLFANLRDTGVRMTQVSLAATASAYEKANLWKWPIEILRHSKRSKVLVGPVLYGAALDVLEKCGIWKETAQIMEELRSIPSKPGKEQIDPLAMSAAISACSKGDWRQTLSLTVEAVKNSPDALSTEAWNACLRGCIPYVGETLLAWMDKSYFEPDMLSYAALDSSQHIIPGAQSQLVSKVRLEAVRALWRLREKLLRLYAMIS